MEWLGHPEEDWPSHWWLNHPCPNRRRCPHPLPTPGWWLLMAGRGVPFSSDRDEALALAKARIATYKGSKPVFDQATREFVQGIVLDALIAAPQPVTGGWVHTSLMAVGGLVRWALQNSEPLEREHLLSTRTRTRFVNLGTAHLEDVSRRNYRCRLDLIATALSGAPIVPTATRALPSNDPVDPHNDTEVATLWVWANGLRPEKRRTRVTASIILCLGCGLRSRELVLVRAKDVSRDANGVHVIVHGTAGDRLVTCDAAWEERLEALVEGADPECLLTSPWRETAATARGVQSVTAASQRTTTAPVRFSPRSLRNTWLVARLSQGTPVPTLLEAAGINCVEALGPYLSFVTAPSPEQRAAFLRGEC